MSSSAKKVRRSRGGVDASAQNGSTTVENAHNVSVQNPSDDVPMDDADLDPASLYEDEEGNSEEIIFVTKRKKNIIIL